jgi:hypothetical protein
MHACILQPKYFSDLFVVASQTNTKQKKIRRETNRIIELYGPYLDEYILIKLNDDCGGPRLRAKLLLGSPTVKRLRTSGSLELAITSISWSAIASRFFSKKLADVYTTTPAKCDTEKLEMEPRMAPKLASFSRFLESFATSDSSEPMASGLACRLKGPCN